MSETNKPETFGLNKNQLRSIRDLFRSLGAYNGEITKKMVQTWKELNRMKPSVKAPKAQYRL